MGRRVVLGTQLWVRLGEELFGWSNDLNGQLIVDGENVTRMRLLVDAAFLELIPDLVVVPQLSGVGRGRWAAKHESRIYQLFDWNMVLQPHQSAKVVVVGVAQEDSVDFLDASRLEEWEHEVAAGVEARSPTVRRGAVGVARSGVVKTSLARWQPQHDCEPCAPLNVRDVEHRQDELPRGCGAAGNGGLSAAEAVCVRCERRNQRNKKCSRRITNHPS